MYVYYAVPLLFLVLYNIMPKFRLPLSAGIYNIFYVLCVNILICTT